MTSQDTDRQRRIRNTALVFGGFAIALYVAFIVFSITRGS
jgi:hypothetical protein